MAKSKDITLETEIGVIGRSHEIYKALLLAVHRKGGTRDDMKRILNEPALMISIADLIVSPASLVKSNEALGQNDRLVLTDDASLPPDHYRVHVTYTSIPSMEDLKREWGENNVSDIFDGRSFALHPSCQDMDRAPGEKIFYLHDTDVDRWKNAEQIAWGLCQRSAVAPNGYRPATHEETYEFAQAHPELADFVGIGSFAIDSDIRCVAIVYWLAKRRMLESAWFIQEWPRKIRVLFVCKEEAA